MKLKAYQFTIRQLMWLTLIVATFCSLWSFDYSYRSPYYEARGYAAMYHPKLRIGLCATWAGDGFSRKYGPEFGVYYPSVGIARLAFVYWDWYYGGPLAFRFYNR